MSGMRGMVGLALMMGIGAGVAGAQQQTAPAPVAPATAPAEAPATVPSPVSAPPLPADGAPVQAAPSRSTDAPALPADGDPPKQTAAPAAGTPGAPPPAPTDKPAPAARVKKGKQPYTGPTEVVELEPTPMLDEEGRQRLDPDGKAMFNPPVKQQRDKQGHPLFDAKGQPVFQTRGNLGYDDNGKKIKVEKEKKSKTVALSIVHGTLTVDGMTGKAGLNYEIADLKYIYLYAPWVGLTVVSNDPFPGAIEQKDAFNENTLTVTAGDHTYQLYSDKKMLGKKPEPAYVMVDREFNMPVRFPMVGYGNISKAPYAFPGSKIDVRAKGSDAPPLPADLLPAGTLPPCPQGQMRPAGSVQLPGRPAPACVAIKAASPAK